jgi:hypothetical protein
MNMIWNSPTALAITAVVVCLLALPLVRLGLLSGATGTATCLGYAIPLFIVGMLEKPYDTPDFGTPRGFIQVFIAGIMLSFGFRFALRAFALYGTKR